MRPGFIPRLRSPLRRPRCFRARCVALSVLWSSLCSGRIALPRHLGQVSLGAFYGLVCLHGVVVGGHGPVVMQTVTAAAGFAIEDVRVSGNQHTSEIDILQLLGLDGSTSLLGLDIAGARKASVRASLGRIG